MHVIRLPIKSVIVCSLAKIIDLIFLRFYTFPEINSSRSKDIWINHKSSLLSGIKTGNPPSKLYFAVGYPVYCNEIKG